MVKVLISFPKPTNNKNQGSVTFKNLRDFQFSKYMNFLALDSREYTYLLSE